MFISEAFAQSIDTVGGAPAGPSPLWNFGMLAVMVVLFYVLLIRPQQKRFKEHSQMLSAISKGDHVVTGGGLVGTVEKVTSDDELVVNLGGGIKVTAMRSTITSKSDKAPAVAAANDKPAKKTAAKKAPAAKKAAATKKPAAKKAPVKKTAAKSK